MTFFDNWVTTEDGSLSWYDPVMDELHHNRAGAYLEAMTQYVTPLLEAFPQKTDWRVLDACYGLGYNTWAFLQAVIPKKPQTLTVSGVDIDPTMFAHSLTILDQPILNELKQIIGTSEHKIYYQTHMDPNACYTVKGYDNWVNTLNQVMAQPGFDGLSWQMQGAWGQLTVNWMVNDLTKALTELSGPFDAVFHDAFSWHKGPELWSAELFSFYRVKLSTDGVVLTYSRASSVKQALITAGFTVENTPGLGRRKGGVVATKNHKTI